MKGKKYKYFELVSLNFTESINGNHFSFVFFFQILKFPDSVVRKNLP